MDILLFGDTFLDVETKSLVKNKHSTNYYVISTTCYILYRQYEE